MNGDEELCSLVSEDFIIAAVQGKKKENHEKQGRKQCKKN